MPTAERRCVRLGLVSMLLLGAACSEDDVLCAPLRPEAVAVDVRDAGTGLSVAGHARGAAQVGSRIDSLVLERIAEAPDSVLLGGSSGGVYEVRVESDGYAAWSQAGVQARFTEGQCPTFETQLLTAELQPIEGLAGPSTTLE